MKKLLTLALAIVMLLLVVSCGETPETTTDGTTAAGTVSTEPDATEATDPLATVLEDKAHELWVAHGQYLLADGTQNGWNGKDSDLYEKSALTAISLNDVKAISEDLFTTLSGKEVKYLYAIDLIFGTNDAGWTTKFLKDGTLYTANGSYAVKIAQCTSDVDGDTKVYAEEQWISDPHTAYVESLTPATVFYPTWQEEKDENGFSWADNPVVTGGAGLYTLVIAQYKNASSAGQPGFGVGLVLKEAQEGIDYAEVPAEHTYGIVGSFTGSNWGNDGADVLMTSVGDNTWSGEVELKAGDEFKVRADNDWANNWGNGGDNFVCEADGTYVVTLTLDENGNGTVTVTEK